MDKDQVAVIPFYAHEAILTRVEMNYKETIDQINRINRRLWILCMVLFITFVGFVIGVLYYESQWQDIETTTVTQDLSTFGGGDAVINDGVHLNGENETNSN